MNRKTIRLRYLTDMALFRPKEKIGMFTDLDIKRYRELGFDTILLDIDNTIAVPNTGTCDERAEQFIRDLEEAGFKVVIFSNNTKKRVEMFKRDIPVDYNCWSMKPVPFSYLLTCKRMKTKPERTIVLGDQLITDILGANLSGCYGIYCKQLQEKDSMITSVNRKIEKFIWRHILHEEV